MCLKTLSPGQGSRGTSLAILASILIYLLFSRVVEKLRQMLIHCREIFRLTLQKKTSALATPTLSSPQMRNDAATLILLPYNCILNSSLTTSHGISNYYPVRSNTAALNQYPRVPSPPALPKQTMRGRLALLRARSFAFKLSCRVDTAQDGEDQFCIQKLWQHIPTSSIGKASQLLHIARIAENS